MAREEQDRARLPAPCAKWIVIDTRFRGPCLPWPRDEFQHSPGLVRCRHRRALLPPPSPPPAFVEFLGSYQSAFLWRTWAETYGEGSSTATTFRPTLVRYRAWVLWFSWSIFTQYRRSTSDTRGPRGTVFVLQLDLFKSCCARLDHFSTASTRWVFGVK